MVHDRAEGLSGFDTQLRVRPLLAASWETPDERTYLFDLRPGLRFSDGRPLTADDVVASATECVVKDDVVNSCIEKMTNLLRREAMSRFHLPNLETNHTRRSRSSPRVGRARRSWILRVAQPSRDKLRIAMLRRKSAKPPP